MKRFSITYAVVLTLLMGGFTACEDMLDVSSTSIQYEDTHSLSSAGDSLYSVVGILSKLQNIADRTVLLGELRADLVTDNENTEKDLRELINHDVKPGNAYLDYSDYYAVINNCNYYLAKVDTNVIVSGQKVMLKEVAVVKGIRAWTYMQLALIYKSVPFITEPILSLQDAERVEEECEYKNLEEMCDYFIPELLPLADIKLPNYGWINDYDSQGFFFPIRLLLGDMYLWKGQYMAAVSQYADYLIERKLYTGMSYGAQPSAFSAFTNDIVGAYPVSYSSEFITIIRMASSKLHGTTSNLENIFSPTDINEGKRAVAPSRAWKELSEKQIYAYQGSADDKVRYLTCGDLRAAVTYGTEWSDGSFRPDRVTSSEAWYDVDVDNKYLINSKYAGNNTALGIPHSVAIYRIGNVYLRLAEAVNRSANGYPDIALAILKQGIEEIRLGLDGVYNLIPPVNDFNNSNVVGIHSRGSGSSAANEFYGIDYSDFDFSVEPDFIRRKEEEGKTLNDRDKEVDYILVKDSTYYGSAGMPNPDFANGYYSESCLIDSTIIEGQRDRKLYTDTIRYRLVPKGYMVDKVEQMIVDEMALETAFEGHRFYDLMRVAMRRNDPAFLADKVAGREGEAGEYNKTLFNKLNDPSYDSWYLHKEK